MKNVLLADDTCRVPFLSDTYEGSTHDKPIADQTPYPLPEGSELVQDLGFVGLTLAGIQITQPHKKPRKKTLTAEQKAENRVIAHRRVRIEHIRDYHDLWYTSPQAKGGETDAPLPE